MANDEPDKEMLESLRTHGLLNDITSAVFEPLTGGVSSDIWKVTVDGRVYCVKRALPKLKVQADWFAPVERNRFEVTWCQLANQHVPGSAPRILAHDEKAMLCVMEFLDPKTHRLWKNELHEGKADPHQARLAGEFLATIHAKTAKDESLHVRFPRADIFQAIRLEPYLEATADKHPDLKEQLYSLSKRTGQTRLTMIHGDVSPKNILIGPNNPVFLDAECACIGDPAFDIAFCLNHFLLKCLWTPSATKGYLTCFKEMTSSYLNEIDWEDPDKFEERAAKLLPGLFLARVDGKSPAEYITKEADKNKVRACARALLFHPRKTIGRCCPSMEKGTKQMSASIVNVIGRRVWDSRGRPTIEAEVHLDGGVIGRSIAPAGASTGSAEAVDKRDGGALFGGYDVMQGVAAVNGEISKALTGHDATDQEGADCTLIDLDGTHNKSRLGGNALIATSMAIAHAAANEVDEPLWRYLGGERDDYFLPLPEIQIFGGGAHAGRRVDVQDFMIIAVGAQSYEQALEWSAEVYRCAGTIMSDAGLYQGVADEGGFWPAFDTNEQALDFLVRSIEKAGFVPGENVAISLDIAASDFGKNGSYQLAADGKTVDSDGLSQMLLGWLERYPIIAIEDPLGEDDPQAMVAFTKAAGDKVEVIADDFICTSAARIKDAGAMGACNTALIKPNQAGTLSETKAAFIAAKKAGWQSIVSARSGETEDVTIVHLAVGWGAKQLKVGSFARSERMAKWNEGLRIAQALGQNGGDLAIRSSFPWGK